MVQIYNEVIDNLLEDVSTKNTKSRAKQVIRRTKKDSNSSRIKKSTADHEECEWEVENLTWHNVTGGASHLLQKFAEGLKRLRIAETKMNKKSSR